MADIRKRTGKKGVTYQVRYPSKAAKTGYAFATFPTLKEARAFLEGGKTREAPQSPQTDICTVRQAADLWLRICEKEGLNGREPVTAYTHKNYEYRARFITLYDWKKDIRDLTPPDVVAFRSWLIAEGLSRDLAGKVLSSFQSIMKEMTIRGVLPHNVASGICIRADSRYHEAVVVPSKRDVVQLLAAADRLANSRNALTARTWERYRPILYLAADSGMRPQEYLAVAKSAIDARGVHVTRAIDGGGGSITVTKTPAGRRYIELSPETVDMVRHYSDHHAAPNDFDLVFPASNRRWMCRKNWQRRGFNAACIEAGLVETVEQDGERIEVPKYRPYDLRHFFASMLIEKQTNLKKIQKLMGHENIETTLNVYGHLLDDDHNAKANNSGMLGGLLADSCGESVALTG
jgi:integrase